MLGMCASIRSTISLGIPSRDAGARARGVFWAVNPDGRPMVAHFCVREGCTGLTVALVGLYIYTRAMQRKRGQLGAYTSDLEAANVKSRKKSNESLGAMKEL